MQPGLILERDRILLALPICNYPLQAQWRQIHGGARKGNESGSAKSGRPGG